MSDIVVSNLPVLVDIASVGVQGAQGLQGLQGVQGPVGPQGPQGLPGAAVGIGEAPTDGTIYGRKGNTATWLNVLGLATGGTVSAATTFSAALTASGGGSVAGTFSGTPTWSGAHTFSAAGTALTVSNNTVLGNSSAGSLVISGSASNALVNATKGVQFALGGNGNSFIVNAPGMGNPFVVTQGSASGLHVVDTTAASLLRTKYNFVNAGALTLAGAYSTNTSPLAMTMNLSGTPGATGGGYPLMQWNTTGDTAVAATSGFLKLIDIQHNWGGAAMTGGRIALNVHVNQQAASGNTIAVNPFYQAFNVAADAAFNEGGTGTSSGTASGHNFAMGAYARLATGATNFFANNCCEWDVQAQTGSSVMRQMGNSIVHLSQHAVQGAVDDAALLVADQAGGTAGWKTVFQVGSVLGQDPLGAGSSILRWMSPNNPATKPPQATTGIDISIGTISGSAFASRDFRVASGAVYPFQGAITQTGAGIAIDVPNYIIGYASINNGTTTLGRVGDWYGDPTTGLIVSIATLSGTTLVTGAAIQRVGYAASNPGPVTVSNLNVDTGGSFIVNVTATLNNTLALQPTAGGKMTMPALQASTTYANDAAAATGGVPIGGVYRNGSVVQVRIS